MIRVEINPEASSYLVQHRGTEEHPETHPRILYDGPYPEEALAVAVETEIHTLPQGVDVSGQSLHHIHITAPDEEGIPDVYMTDPLGDRHEIIMAKHCPVSDDSLFGHVATFVLE